MNLSVGHTPVATHNSGESVPSELSPRPYLHPVRTLAGTEVTETLPADHRHHLGVSVTLADVSGTSFWGGRTFTREHGSVMLDNHGRQTHLSWADHAPDRTTELLSWTDREGTELLREERTLRALPLDATTWVLDLRSSLRNTSGRELGIGSPATNGRPGAGYGGVFWRAPIGDRPPSVTGPDGMSGEDALHGSSARWLALASTASHDSPWTLLFLRTGPRTDPWFLRAREYPGVCPAPAWNTRQVLPAGQTLELGLRTAVTDGSVTDHEALANAVAALV
ncbi:DUF6807 domain-containing protein [Nocardiopsis ganjiahuensis]|uniref:DUF6807 domain-containing protein n=1 Tax=Nocardiopsis ganjiahuensis TaxID=239984 RepID=UPI00034DE8EC